MPPRGARTATSTVTQHPPQKNLFCDGQTLYNFVMSRWECEDNSFYKQPERDGVIFTYRSAMSKVEMEYQRSRLTLQKDGGCTAGVAVSSGLASCGIGLLSTSSRGLKGLSPCL